MLTFNLWYVAFVATADGQKFEEWGCEVKLFQIWDESRLQTFVIRCIFEGETNTGTMDYSPCLHRQHELPPVARACATVC